MPRFHEAVTVQYTVPQRKRTKRATMQRNAIVLLNQELRERKQGGSELSLRLKQFIA